MPLVSQVINCPSCGEPVEVEDRYAGWTVRCPICRHEFVAPEAPAPPLPEPPVRRARSRSRREAAARAVADAAVWLKVQGWLDVGLLLVGLCGLIAAQAANNPAQAVQALNVQNEEELWGTVVVWTAVGVLTAAVGVVILVGAGRMARLESHSWAMTAGVLACLPILNWCCCVGLPVGLWAIAVLGRPEVQDAFAAARTRPELDDEYPEPPAA